MKHYIDVDIHVGTITFTNSTSYPYKYLQETMLTDPEINEVTTSVSLSAGMSPTIEKISSLIPGVNPRKQEHTC
jgi:hypothetical protein